MNRREIRSSSCIALVAAAIIAIHGTAVAQTAPGTFGRSAGEPHPQQVPSPSWSAPAPDWHPQQLGRPSATRSPKPAPQPAGAPAQQTASGAIGIRVQVIDANAGKQTLRTTVDDPSALSSALTSGWSRARTPVCNALVRAITQPGLYSGVTFRNVTCRSDRSLRFQLTSTTATSLQVAVFIDNLRLDGGVTIAQGPGPHDLQPSVIVSGQVLVAISDAVTGGLHITNAHFTPKAIDVDPSSVSTSALQEAGFVKRALEAKGLQAIEQTVNNATNLAAAFDSEFTPVRTKVLGPANYPRTAIKNEATRVSFVFSAPGIASPSASRAAASSATPTPSTTLGVIGVRVQVLEQKAGKQITQTKLDDASALSNAFAGGWSRAHLGVCNALVRAISQPGLVNGATFSKVTCRVDGNPRYRVNGTSANGLLAAVVIDGLRVDGVVTVAQGPVHNFQPTLIVGGQVLLTVAGAPKDALHVTSAHFTPMTVDIDPSSIPSGTLAALQGFKPMIVQRGLPAMEQSVNNATNLTAAFDSGFSSLASKIAGPSQYRRTAVQNEASRVTFLFGK